MPSVSSRKPRYYFAGIWFSAWGASLQLGACREEFVDIPCGRVRLLRAGAGYPVILLHGLVGSSENWRANIGALSAHAEVFSIDQMNMGRSQRVVGLNVGLEAHADRIVTVMQSLGLETANVVGHSHGGAVAMMLAACHPERVRSLLLFAAANPYCDLAQPLIRFYSSRLGAAVLKLVPHLPRALQQHALERMYGDPTRVPPGCLDVYMAGLRVRGTTNHIRAIVKEWFTDMEALRRTLAGVKQVPTWLVWGDRDRAVGLQSGKRLSQEVGCSNFVVVPGAGHVVFEEFPELVNRILLQWLEQDTMLSRESGRGPVVSGKVMAAQGSATYCKGRLDGVGHPATASLNS